jgi:hypothetical protein
MRASHLHLPTKKGDVEHAKQYSTTCVAFITMPKLAHVGTPSHPEAISAHNYERTW